MPVPAMAAAAQTTGLRPVRSEIRAPTKAATMVPASAMPSAAIQSIDRSSLSSMPKTRSR